MTTHVSQPSAISPRVRRRPAFVLAALALVLALGSTIAARAAAQAQAGDEAAFDLAATGVTLVPVAEGLDRPLWVTTAPDAPDRLYVVEQPGTVRIVEGGRVGPRPFLDITDRVGTEGFEQGLLGLAFHPDYRTNGTFYAYYTDLDGDSVLSRFTLLDGNRNMANPASEAILLTQDQPFPNHNGGALVFGPDGYLYLGLGDGGSGGDPEGNAQDLGTILGKVLRIAVDPSAPADGELYSIPEDNPFADDPDARPEIWAYGLRNPWRLSFDSETGDLWIADVGQNEWEELNHQPGDSAGGENYGWVIREGAHCFEAEECATEGLVDPVAEYSHEFGNSVTGGYVYRGDLLPDLAGTYLFADFGTGLLWGLRPGEGGAWEMSAPIETGLNISSFGQDGNGELFVTAFDGVVYQVAPQP